MYADIKQMGTLKDKSAAAKFNKKQKELNGLPAMDYEAVNQTKWEYFRLIFKQEGEKVLASGESSANSLMPTRNGCNLTLFSATCAMPFRHLISVNGPDIPFIMHKI